MTHLRRKQSVIEGYRHDGTDVKAFAIAHWINANGGKAQAFQQGEYQAYPNEAVVRIFDDRVAVNLIISGSWAVSFGNGDFVGVPHNVINMAYDILDEPTPVQPQLIKEEKPGGLYS